jgi:hypothetical protein
MSQGVGPMETRSGARFFWAVCFAGRRATYGTDLGNERAFPGHELIFIFDGQPRPVVVKTKTRVEGVTSSDTRCGR